MLIGVVENIAGLLDNTIRTIFCTNPGQKNTNIEKYKIEVDDINEHFDKI